ncbi:Crp/Fnr family transcriptional regulator [bacterium]|nr:MAG: Crp/Fnr family transcriptional regulator [bacterium]
MTADVQSLAPVSVDACRAAFEAIPQLATLNVADCGALAPMLSEREFPAGSILFYEDDDSDAAYFLASGAIEIFKSNPEGKKLPLVVLRDGGLLGEIGLLISEHRTATARALGSVRVLELSRNTFEAEVQKGNPAALNLSLAFARILAQRLASTNEKMFELFQSDVSGEMHHQLSELQMRLLTRWTA